MKFITWKFPIILMCMFAPKWFIFLILFLMCFKGLVYHIKRKMKIYQSTLSRQSPHRLHHAVNWDKRFSFLFFHKDFCYSLSTPYTLPPPLYIKHQIHIRFNFYNAESSWRILRYFIFSSHPHPLTHQSES